MCSTNIEKRQRLLVKLIQGGRRVRNAQVYYEVAVMLVELAGAMGWDALVWMGCGLSI
jgi:predicted Rossmann-fold nucleotide-binding protein